MGGGLNVGVYNIYAIIELHMDCTGHIFMFRETLTSY